MVSKRALLDAVWGDAPIEEANLSQNIYVLRRYFQSASGDAFIETLPKRGYRFNATATRRPASPPSPAPSQRPPIGTFAAALLLLVAGALLSSAAYRSDAVAVHAHLRANAERADALGWYYLRRPAPDSLRSSIGQFKQVVAFEPASAEGYAGEAVAYARLSDFEGASPSGVADAVSAQRLSDRAMSIEPSSAAALAARGFVEYDLLDDTEDARADLSRAVRIDPSSGFSREWYGASLLWSGDLPGARAQLARAEGIDPGLPALEYLLALCDYMSRRYGDAAGFAALGTGDPLSGDADRLLLGAAYDEAHRYRDAIAVLKTVSDSPSDALAKNGALAHVYASMGAVDRARQAVDAVRRLARWQIDRPVLTAIAYESIGDADDAFASLSQLSSQDRRLFGLDPRLDPLRKDGRFARWLRS